jgi:thioredoxin 1
MAGNIQEVTDDTFKDATAADRVTLVDFWAPWCGPCRRLNPVIEELSQEMGDKVNFLKLNTDENPETGARFGIMSIPTLLVFKGGEKVDQLIGAHPKDNIRTVLEKHI